MSTKYTTSGKLEYLGYDNKWTLTHSNGTVTDIRDPIMTIIDFLNGEKAEFNYTKDSLKIERDIQSKSTLSINKHGVVIVNFFNGFSNVTSYISRLLENFNSRYVTFSASSDFFELTVDPNEDVNAVSHTNGNSCKIDDGKEDTVCKIGTTDCCIFLTVSKDGFFCEKFSSIGTLMLDRYAEGMLNATRIGNCKIVRKQPAEAEG